MSYLPILKLTGLFAALWMFIGVSLVARKFPGYSHKDQVMSELGAKGRPSARIHPLVNNYPIATLFIVFGISILSGNGSDLPMVTIGLLVATHGVSHLVTGLFPCDEDLGIPNASRTQIIHNTAGLVMLMTLLAASIVGALSALVVAPPWFEAFSLTCALVSVMYAIQMARSLSTGICSCPR